MQINFIQIPNSRSFQQLSNGTASDTDNNNGPSRVFYTKSKPTKVIPPDTTSSSSSSKFNHSVAHSKGAKKKPVVTKKPQFTMVKSKSDLNTLKTYPDSFTILPSPKRSPSAECQSGRRKSNLDDEDEMMDFDWVKPPPEKLYEAANSGDKSFDEPTYVTDHFGQLVSMPTSPILTDKIMVGSSNR